MNLREKMQRRLKLNRPSLRARARPPKQRSPLGAQFTAANLPTALALPCCRDCGHVQYPPTELCGECLGDTLIYRPVPTEGTVLATTCLRHSLWEYFKRRLANTAWTIGSIKLDAGPVVLAHMANQQLQAGDRVNVFSHTDASQQAVLLATAINIDTSTAALRRDIVSALSLDIPAYKDGGL